MAVTTEHLLLRRFEESDLEALWPIHSDREAMRFTFCPATPEESSRHLRAYAALHDELGYAPWTALHGRRVVGWGGLNIDPFLSGWGPEVSYFFAPEVWGRGFAGELVRAALGCGFDAHDLETICAFTRPENAASARVLQKCGFEKLRHVPELERDYYEIGREAWRSSSPGTGAARTTPMRRASCST
jgi:ribosomal-protein-alanine N-acetyltransferase